MPCHAPAVPSCTRTSSFLILRRKPQTNPPSSQTLLLVSDSASVSRFPIPTNTIQIFEECRDGLYFVNLQTGRSVCVSGTCSVPLRYSDIILTRAVLFCSTCYTLGFTSTSVLTVCTLLNTIHQPTTSSPSSLYVSKAWKTQSKLPATPLLDS
jgi:hypothetical protein